MIFGSLFAGIGGFDLALERCGFTCAWQCEIDPQCRSVLARHWPDVRRFDDVRSLSDAPRVDLLCGGWPCQDLSVAGNRAGLAGERSGLFFEVVRIARDLAPRWLFLENVPGLLSSHGGRDMGAVLWALGELGYRWAYRVLDAQFFGVPQRRRRVFIVASLGAGCPGEVLLEPDRMPWDSEARGEAGEGVAALLAGGARGRGWRVGADEAAGGQILAFDETQITHPENRCNPQPGDPSHPLAATGRPPTLAFGWANSASQGLPIDEEVTPPIRSNRHGEGAVAQFDGHSANKVQSDVAVSNTLDGDGRDGIVTPSSIRRLTPRECERLQGLPDDWTHYAADGSEISDSARYRMIGNGVAVPVVEWIGKRLFEVRA